MSYPNDNNELNALQNFNYGYYNGLLRGTQINNLVFSNPKKIIKKINYNNLKNNLDGCLYNDNNNLDFDKEEIKFPNIQAKKDYDNLINNVIKSIINDNWSNQNLNKRLVYGEKLFYKDVKNKKIFAKNPNPNSNSNKYEIVKINTFFNDIGKDLTLINDSNKVLTKEEAKKEENIYFRTNILDKNNNNMNIFVVPNKNNLIDNDFKTNLNNLSTDFNVLNFTSNKILRMTFLIMIINTIQKAINYIYEIDSDFNENNFNIMFKGGITMRSIVFNMIDTFNISGEKDFYNKYKKYFKISDFDFELMINHLEIEQDKVTKVNILFFFILIELNKYFYKYRDFYFEYYKFNKKEKKNIGNKLLNNICKEFNESKKYNHFSVIGICIESANKLKDCLICDEVSIDIPFNQYKDKTISDKGIQLTPINPNTNTNDNSLHLLVRFNDGTLFNHKLNYKGLNTSELVNYFVVEKNTNKISNFFLRIKIKNNIVNDSVNLTNLESKYFNITTKKIKANIFSSNSFAVLNPNESSRNKIGVKSEFKFTGIIPLEDLTKLYDIKYNKQNLTETIYDFYSTHNNLEFFQKSKDSATINFNLNRTKKFNTLFLYDNNNNRYYYIRIKGELIDVSASGVRDTRNHKYYISYDNNKYFSKYTILDYKLNNNNVNYLSYSLIGHISDLTNILFIEHNYKPWHDIKYAKRIYRLVIILYLKLFIFNEKNQFFSAEKRIEFSKNFINSIKYNKKLKVPDLKFLDVFKSFLNNINIMNNVTLTPKQAQEFKTPNWKQDRQNVINNIIKISKELHNFFCKHINQSKLIHFENNKFSSNPYNIRNRSIY